MTEQRTLFVGIGSRHGDDQIGWRVADSLRSRVSSGVEVREASTPSHLLDWLDGADRLIVCDACPARRRADSGEQSILHRWRWPTLQVSMLRSAGSHSFGLPQVLQLAERLGTLPKDVIVFGVEGTRFDAFSEMSPSVGGALETIVETILEESGVVPVPTGRDDDDRRHDGRWEPVEHGDTINDVRCEDASHA